MGLTRRFYVLATALLFCLEAMTGRAQVTNPAGHDFGTISLGQSAFATVTFNFTGSVSVASVSVVTQGATGKDFQATTPDSSGTLCKAAMYSSGDSCTVDITFAPLAPGKRLGAAVLRDSSNRILAAGYVTGFGAGAQLGFTTPTVSTFVGTGTYSLTNPSGSSGTSAGFIQPNQIAFDGAGNMYMADFMAEMIYKITPDGLVSTVLGNYRTSCGSNYTCGYPRTNSTTLASSSKVYLPQSIAVDGAGLLWFTDNSVAGLATVDLASGYVTAQVPGSGNPAGHPTTSGNIHSLGAASLGSIFNVATDGLGNVYVSAAYDGTQTTFYGMILKLDPSGNISVFAGNTTPFYGTSAPADGTPATSAVVGTAWGMGIDGSGNFYYFDQGYNQIFKIDAAGKLHPFAGSGSTSSDNTSGLPYWQSGTASTISNLSVNFATKVGMLAVDPNGDVFLPSGPSSYSNSNSSSRVFVFTPSGYAYVLAGTGALGETNGPASSAELAQPTSVALNGTGDVYISENYLRQSSASPAVYVGSSVRKWTMAASTLSFGPQAMGSTSAGQTVTATNLGNAPLVLTALSNGTNPDPGSSFTLLSNSAFNACGTGSSGAVDVGSDCSVIAAFEPHQSSGSISGSLVYTGNLPGGTTSVPMAGTAAPGVSSLKLTGLPTTATSGASNTVTVSALDGSQNPFASYTGTLHFSLSPTDVAASLPSDYTFSAADGGTKTFSVALSAPGAETLTVADTANGLSANQSTTVVSAVDHFAFTAAPPTTTSAGTSFNVTVTAYSSIDSSEVATSYTGPVKFTSSDSNAVLPTTGLTLSNGVGTFSITLETVGTQTITVADSSGSPSVTSSNITVEAAAPTTGAIATAILGANQVTLQLTSSATGRGYFTLLAGGNATCGSAAQTAAGQDSTGAAAYRFGSLPLTATVAGSYTVRNLMQSTTYTACFTPDGSAAPVSTAVTTTTAASNLNSAWTTVGAAGFSAGAAYSESMTFAPDGTPYVAFDDAFNGYKATVMKYDGTSWTVVGSAGFSASYATYESLAFAPDGTPYVAFQDSDDIAKATVMKYDGTSWTAVGSASFSPSFAYYESLAFAPDGTPYVAFLDGGNSSKATVMKYDGTSWTAVGSAGFSAAEADYESLAFAPDGTPYVAFEDASNSNMATVMKYDGTSWTVVGSAGFSAGVAYNESLAFAPDGTPYVAFLDGGNSSKATVMKYDGTSWTAVGSAGFSAGVAYNESLAFAPDGMPYVAFEDGGNGNKTTVMKYDGTSWTAVGSAGFSAGAAFSESLTFAPDGTPYVAYSDDNVGDNATVMALLPQGPTAVTDAATDITTSSATLNGTVNPQNSNTTVTFEFGPTTGYGTTVPATTPRNGVISAGTASTAASVAFTGLTPNTTYHFRVDAMANGVTVNGQDETFTTTEMTTPTITTWPTASGITFGQTLASSTLSNGAASVPGTFTWTTPATAPNAGIQTERITFTPTDTTDYNTVSGAVNVTVSAATLTVTASSAAVSYGAGVPSISPNYSGFQNYDTAASLATAATCSTTYTTTSHPGSYPTTCSGAVDTNYTFSYVAGAVTVSKAAPTVSAWPTAGTISYGQALSAAALTGGSHSVDGAFTWTTPTTAPKAGTQTEGVTFTPTDTTDYNTVTGTVNVTVSAATLTVTASSAAVSYGAGVPSISPSYSGFENNDTAASLATAATCSTTYTTTNHPGSYPTICSGAVDANYTFSYVAGAVTVSKATPTVSAWPTASGITFGQMLASSRLSNGAASVPGTFTWTTPATAPSAGTQTEGVTFTPTDTTDYNKVSGTVSVTTDPATPIVSAWPTASSITYGQTLTRSNLTGGAASYSGSSVPGIFAWTTSTTAPDAGSQTESVTFTPSDTTNYSPVIGRVAVIVNKAAGTVTLGNLNQIYTGSPLSATVTTNPSGLTVKITYNGSATAPTAVGSYSVAATIDDANYEGSLSGTLIIGKAAPTVSTTPTASAITYGQTLANSTLTGGVATYEGKAVSGAFAWSASTRLPTAGSQGEPFTFTPADTADYTAITGTVTLAVKKATATLNGPATQPVRVIDAQAATIQMLLTGQFSGAGIATPSGSISYVVSGNAFASGTAVITNGAATIPVPNTVAPGDYTVTVSYPGDGNYNAAASTTIALQVGQIQPVIHWAQPAAITYGAALAGVLNASALNGSNAVPGTFTYLNGTSPVTAATILSAGAYTLTVNFTPTDTTTYKTATASVALTVNQAGVSGITLTSTVNPVLVTNVTTLTATLSSATGRPTGTVTFFDGTSSTPLGIATLSGGIAQLPVSTLAVGTHSITAVYSGDSNFLAATSAAISEQVQDFNLAISTTSGPGSVTTQTVVPGATADYSFIVSPTGTATFPAAVALSVSGLPPGATYTINPTSIAAGSGPTTVTLTVSVPSQAANRKTPDPFGIPGAPLTFAVLLLPFARRLRKTSRRLRRAAMLSLLVIASAMSVVGLSGCGARTGFFAQQQQSYTVTITGSAGSDSHSTSVTLIVE